MCAYVHHGDARLVELLDGPFGGDADGADEERGLLFDDDVKQIGKLALGVVVLWAHASRINRQLMAPIVEARAEVELTFVFRAFPPTWGRSRSTPKGRLLSTRSSLIALI